MNEIPTYRRPHPLSSGAEREQLTSWLAFYRATLLRKCAGLNVEQLSLRPVPSSTMSLLGTLRHMTFVEQVWFDARFTGNDVDPYYRQSGDREAEWTQLDSATLDEVLANYGAACARSDELSAGHALEEMITGDNREREPVDLRWIYIHMIEEYARHCGHADLMRELIDGVTGE